MADSGASDGWPTESSSYVIREDIGQGAFARVVRAWCAAKDCEVAIKIISLDRVSTSLDDIRTEVRVMKICSCYYIMRALERTHAVREGTGLPEEAIAMVLREAVKGLVYLHDNNQIHRDIKAGNILVNSAGEVRLADFGVAGWLHESSTRRDNRRDTFVGTPCWMAPEVMEQSKGYDAKADIWSIGITALELAKGYAPYAQLPPMQVLIKTLREPPPSLKTYKDGHPLELSSKFDSFVARCLRKDPESRPSAAELLQDKFLKSAHKSSKLATILSRVPDIRAPEAEGETAEGAAPAATAAAAEEAPKYVHGTTWDFGDGTQLPSAATEAKAEAATAQISALAAEFGEEEGHTDDEGPARPAQDATAQIDGLAAELGEGGEPDSDSEDSTAG